MIPRSLPGVSALNGSVLKNSSVLLKDINCAWTKQAASTGRPTEGRGTGYGISP